MFCYILYMQTMFVFLLHVFVFLKAYEKGVALFRWPNVYDIWATYLSKFIERYVSFLH